MISNLDASREETISSIDCPPYPYSTDRWNLENVKELHEALAAQHIDKERATGIFIGTGGVPYILGHIGTSRVITIDQGASVIESVENRIAALHDPDVTNWDLWRENISARMDRSFYTRQFDREYKIALESGLAGDFAMTREKARGITFEGRNENLITSLPSLAQELRDEGREVSIINVTNVAAYLGIQGISIRKDPSQGEKALRRTMQNLPFTKGAIVIETQMGVTARIRLAIDYMQG